MEIVCKNSIEGDHVENIMEYYVFKSLAFTNKFISECMSSKVCRGFEKIRVLASIFVRLQC
jgi:hypothetical protein